ncbi:hypothetical protein DQ04_00571190 [Trypanosoma grayi]|uniref:hypothetical protein n=1 Tax=Trypanosoma grayi TaxID=71804 RepID=UPI0004F47AB4|nr:hypothetical protein DQ04_00571190 [Trypanosoma grayi]KEG14224.1 hypothetical protein DQ04_00571190 [Trypanosoma grayi]
MSRDETDGSLSDVNPDLLELCKDPAAWREQRRRALQEKVFCRGGATNSGGGSGAPFPTGSIPARESVSGGSNGGRQSGRTAEEQEAYVLEQLMSHKRRREEAAKVEDAQTDQVAANKLSTKDKLLQQLKKRK